MFNKELTTVLSEINKMTNTVILKHPQTVAISDSQDIMTLIDVSKLDSEQFENIYLNNNLSEFLKLLKLFGDEKTITVNNNTINVENDTASSSFIMDTPILMEAYDKSPEQFEKTESVPSVATFELTVDDIKRFNEATGVFKDLSEIIFKSQDGDMKIFLGATNKFNAKSNTYTVTKSAETSKEFEIKIPVENFKVLPTSNYTVDVKYNSAKDAYRVLLTNKTIDGLKLLLSVKI